MSGYLTESGLSCFERKQIPVFPFKFRVILTVVQYASVFKQRKPLMKETKHGCMYFALPDKPFHFDITVFIDVERNPGPRFEILGKKDVNSQALESRSTCFVALDLPVKIKYSRTVLFGFKNSNQCVCRGRGTGGQWGNVPPPLFLKVKKVPFFWAKVPQLQNEKKYLLNKRPLLLERKCLFCSSKDSIKAISDVIETPYFQKFSFGS
jgi:hypothetical protein